MDDYGSPLREELYRGWKERSGKRKKRKISSVAYALVCTLFYEIKEYSCAQYFFPNIFACFDFLHFEWFLK